MKKMLLKLALVYHEGPQWLGLKEIALAVDF